MTLPEMIQQQVDQLPLEKQTEVLDFVAFLQQQSAQSKPAQARTLRQHPAFGAWRGREIDALEYQQALRAEWDA